jgi:quercetin dioxygenase-like cupin family protein
LATEPVVSRPGEGELHERSNGYRLIRVATDQISVIEIAFDESLVVDPHVHHDHADSFLVLEGEIEFTLGETTEVLGPGSFVTAPPGARHGFRGADGRAKVLNFHTPDGGFVADIRAASTDGS